MAHKTYLYIHIYVKVIINLYEYTHLRAERTIRWRIWSTQNRSAPTRDLTKPSYVLVSFASLYKQQTIASLIFASFSRYELSDGQYREEKIEILNEGTDDEEIVITGQYSYFGPDGFRYEVNYKADRNGYAVLSKEPTSKMPPVTFAIPPSVLKSLIG